jgi:hypothetical protein
VQKEEVQRYIMKLAELVPQFISVKTVFVKGVQTKMIRQIRGGEVSRKEVLEGIRRGVE